MKKARMLGNYVEHIAKEKQLSVSEMSEILDCEERQVKSFYKGRTLLSFAQITNLAKRFSISVENLLAGNEELYNATVVHCMNDFSDSDNREMILDIIDNYVDIIDAVRDSE